MQHSDRSYFLAAESQARTATLMARACEDRGMPGGAAVWHELAELAGARARDGRCPYCGHGVRAHRVSCPAAVRGAGA